MLIRSLFLTSDIPGNAAEDVPVRHLPKARPDVHRACNRAQLEDKAGGHVGAAESTAECRPRWRLEGQLNRYVILTVLHIIIILLFREGDTYHIIIYNIS